MHNSKWFPNQLLEDNILCHNYNILDSNYKQGNNYTYGESMFVPKYFKCMKNFKDENTVRFPLPSSSCDKDIIQYRGKNNFPSSLDKRNNSFLIPYCSKKKNTYHNVVVCNDDTCCSESHQLFMNCTKRH